MGNQLREVRRKMLMTQEDLARKSGVSRPTIIAIEKGEDRNVLSQTMVAIAEALGKTVGDIFFQEKT